MTASTPRRWCTSTRRGSVQVDACDTAESTGRSSRWLSLQHLRLKWLLLLTLLDFFASLALLRRRRRPPNNARLAVQARRHACCRDCRHVRRSERQEAGLNERRQQKSTTTTATRRNRPQTVWLLSLFRTLAQTAKKSSRPANFTPNTTTPTPRTASTTT